MNKIFRHWMVAAAGAVIAFGFSSCAYDPYYSSVGGSYSSGYGDGYGYGGSNFSTSLFISTGDPRWGYDPYCRSYYDYRSRRYYDPYLYGYYPVGYRPVVVVGAPHPHGWRPGRRYCPPPKKVRNVTVVKYRDRESAYRNSKYSWAKQVRAKPRSQTHIRSQGPSRSSYRSPATYNRTSPYRGNASPSRSNYQHRKSSYRDSSNSSTRSSSRSRNSSGNYSSPNRSHNARPQTGNPDYHPQRSSRNTPVTGTATRQTYTRQRESSSRNRSTEPATRSRPPSTRQPARPGPGYQRDKKGNSGQPSKSKQDKKRAIRGLGQG